jgi:uncharacterized delta-60 repeat protein
MNRRARCAIPLVLVVGLSLTSPAWAAPAPGQLDPTFSGDGRVLLPQAAIGVEVLDSGKALVVGLDWTVRRYNVDGSRDLTYGDHGTARPDLSAWTPIGAADAALQTDGKLVILGAVTSDGHDEIVAVARLTRGGSPDDTFSGDGLKTIQPGVLQASSLAIAPTGRILLCGTTPDALDVAVIALTTTGRRVMSFGGGDGIATIDFRGARDDGEGITVQPDGRIVLVATTYTPGESQPRMGVIRLTAAGVLDPSFSGDGLARVSFSSEVELWGGTWGRDVEVNPDTGDVVVGGNVYNAVPEEEFYAFAVARFGPSGLLEDRWTTVSADRSAQLFALDLVGEDVIAVGMARDVPDCCGWFIVRFGSVQYATAEYFGQLTDEAADVAVTGGKAYVAGRVEVTSGGKIWKGGLARFIA